METTLQHWQKSILMTLVHLVGDLGYFTEDEMVSAFFKSCIFIKNRRNIPRGCRDECGYHIIKKTGEKVQDFDDVKDDLISTLEKTKQTTLMKDLYTKYDVQLKVNRKT